jgi:two-component sensor histidine kinase
MSPFLSGLKNRLVPLFDRYTGHLERNTIEYWQGYIFYVITFVGIIAGTLIIIPSSILLLSRGQHIGVGLMIFLYALCIIMIFHRRLTVRIKTLVIAFNFYLFGVASLMFAGPMGESGIFFSVSVLLCSLFAGLRISIVAAAVNFLTGITFGLLHHHGIIGWSFVISIPLASWLLQSSNILMVDMMFVIANTLLLKGVGRTFRNLGAAEKRIMSSLDEKETLIKELYHRSKNNMQVVSSLLRLHSSELKDEASRAIFKDLVNKIVAMSLVHQKLYESKDLSNIALGEYIRELVTLLLKSYGIPPDRVETIYDIEEVTLLIDTAIPCGLVISEIVANICKYAYPGEAKGYIRIGLKQVDGDTVELSLGDDGVGLPAGFDAAVDGRMGLKTIFTLVRHQLQGTVDLRSGKGLSYVIRFRKKLYDERVKLDG